MNNGSLEKIQSATQFLLWFHYVLPPRLQEFIRPYLAQPYQSALRVLECCSNHQPSSVDKIAEKANLNKETTRQVLKSLQAGGMVFTSAPLKGWQTPKLQNDLGETRQSLEQSFEKSLDLSVSDLTTLDVPAPEATPSC